MNLKQILELNVGAGDCIWAKVDPQAGAFTYDSEATYNFSKHPPEDGYVFFCDGAYQRDHLELGLSLDSLLDEINEIEFPLK